LKEARGCGEKDSRKSTWKTLSPFGERNDELPDINDARNK